MKPGRIQDTLVDPGQPMKPERIQETLQPLPLRLSALSSVFFVRRENQLVGVDACWGTPRDWSGTASRAT